MENRDENERDGHGGRHENEPDKVTSRLIGVMNLQPMIGIVPRRTHTGILRTLSSTSGSINESHHKQFSRHSSGHNLQVNPSFFRPTAPKQDQVSYIPLNISP